MTVRRIALVTVLLIVLPAAPAAATRLAAPNGAITGDCTQTPCRLDRAVTQATSGEQVVLAGGTYVLDAIGPLMIDRRIDLHPASGASRPVITRTGTGDTVDITTNGPGSTISGVEVDVRGSGTGPENAVRAIAPATLNDVVLDARGTSGQGNVSALYADLGATLTNATVRVNGTGTAANGVDASAGRMTLRDVSVTSEFAGDAHAAVGGAAAFDVQRLHVITAGGGCTSIFSTQTQSLEDVVASQIAGGAGLNFGVCLGVHAPGSMRRLTVLQSNFRHGDALALSGSGLSAEDVAVTTPVTGVGVAGDVTVRRANIDAATAIQADGASAVPSKVTDSVLRAAGTGQFGAVASNGGNLALRNVTVLARAGANGLGVDGCKGFSDPCATASLLARDAIVQADGPDLALHAVCQPQPCQGDVAKLTTDHSSFDAGDVQQGPGTTYQPGAGNQDARTLPPVLLDGLHQAASSPTVDAGVADTGTGPLDIDGDPRSLGAGPDIGADELVPTTGTSSPGPSAPPAAGGGGGDAPAGAAGTAPPGDTDAPVIESASVSNRVFRAGGASAAGRRAGVPVGTSFRYALSEPATVTIAITGKRRVCRHRHCRSKAVAAGALSATGAGGSNTTAFSGRIGRRALRPGAYVATLTAVDGAGNRSAPQSVGFRVVHG